jgi:4-carboxymuconolactone decarboxylase
MTTGRESGLTDGTRALVRMSAALASGDMGTLGDALTDAAGACARVEVEEALLQSYLFLGYPTALNALGLWRERAGAAPGPPEPGDGESGGRRGTEVCRTVYGGQYEGLRANVRALHPDLETWMVVEGYGKVLGRPGLSLERRELCIVAMLARQGARVERQLYSHLRGALSAGASRAAVQEALTLALEGAAAPEREGAAEVWGRVCGRATSVATDGHS